MLSILSRATACNTDIVVGMKSCSLSSRSLEVWKSGLGNVSMGEAVPNVEAALEVVLVVR